MSLARPIKVSLFLKGAPHPIVIQCEAFSWDALTQTATWTNPRPVPLHTLIIELQALTYDDERAT